MDAMRDWFEALLREATTVLVGDEVLLMNASAEDSDFARFSQARVRQVGSVEQRELEVELVRGRRHAGACLTLTGAPGEDGPRVRRTVERLRERLGALPEDPYLLYNEQARADPGAASSERVAPARLPAAAEAVEAIQALAAGADLVGLYAAGRLARGFGNSLGQRNWYAARTFSFDWSLYHSADKAVKCDYAGATWEPEQLARRMDEARRKLAVLGRPAHKVPPGRYRVALAPAAVGELLRLLSWGGFGLKAQRTKQSPLLRLVEGAERLDPRVRLVEDTRAGTSPNFQEQGYLKPEAVALVDGGRAAGALVSPRSAREFGVETNGASAAEAPEALAMAPGDLPPEGLLERLGTGVWVGNLHYLNYSDLPACRTTGMTRFATFWVEGGEIRAPLSVMRFDETIYRVFGANLVGLTADSETLLSPDTYQRRSTGSVQAPGALVEDFAFTL